MSPDRFSSPPDTTEITASPSPTSAAVRTTQSTVTAPDSPDKKDFRWLVDMACSCFARVFGGPPDGGQAARSVANPQGGQGKGTPGRRQKQGRAKSERRQIQKILDQWARIS